MITEFSRTEMLIGPKALNALKGSCVVVFGAGGVGSHAIEALARSGIGHLILIDSDTVSLTNINRQSIAYHSTVGQYKTRVMADRIRDICPDTRTDTFEEFVLPDTMETLFCRINALLEEEHIKKSQISSSGSSSITYILDAIDTVSAKIALAAYADEHSIPLISSMGTGNKLHPELFRISDLKDTSVCPLCRVMRKELKTRGIQSLKVCWSPEKPLTPAPAEEDTGSRHPRKHILCASRSRPYDRRRNRKKYLRPLTKPTLQPPATGPDPQWYTGLPHPGLHHPAPATAAG